MPPPTSLEHDKFLFRSRTAVHFHAKAICAECADLVADDDHQWLGKQYLK